MPGFKRRGKDDGMRWALVPRSDGHVCGFCIILASRGYYSSYQFWPHGKRPCRCEWVKGPKDSFDVPGVNCEALFAAYDDARKTIEKMAQKEWEKLPASAKRQFKGNANTFIIDEGKSKSYNEFLARRIGEEIETRDPLWIREGQRLTVSFENDDVLKKVLERPHELRTANRLRKHGVPAHFQIDEVADQTTGLVTSYADLANGYEIKTLGESNAFSTIDTYLRDCSKKKRGVVAVVFDNFDSLYATDEDVESWILESRRFRRGRVYMIGKDGQFRRVR